MMRILAYEDEEYNYWFEKIQKLHPDKELTRIDFTENLDGATTLQAYFLHPGVYKLIDEK